MSSASGAAAMLAAALLFPPAAGSAAGGAMRLDVPALRQAPERCGPAALTMVLAYYGAPDAALREADRAYSPALRGTLITDLAAAARRAGHRARIATPGEDSLRVWLRDSLPPILLYRSGRGPIGRPHYGVLVGWDPGTERYLVNDGTDAARALSRRDLLRRWRAEGGQALRVEPLRP